MASAVKWSQRLRATGSAGARRSGRKQPRSLAAGRVWLLERLETAPDVTLRRLVAELGKRGVMTSYGLVWRIVREAGITFKENTVRHRAGPAGGRQATRAVG